MIKKIFIIFTFVLIIFFNISKVQAKETNMLDTTPIIENLEEYGCKIKVVPITDFQKDEVFEDYYSITYEVITEKCNLSSCFIPWTIGLPYEAIITDLETIENKRYFDNKFKIMLPKENANEEFYARVEVIVDFSLENEEDIHSIDKFITLDSRKSSLEIDIVDNESSKKIEGAELKLENCEFFTTQNYISNKNGKILINRIGKGQTKLEITKVPTGYYMPEVQYMDIQYEKDEKYTIKLEHKKGNLFIDNIPGAKFEIYDIEGKLIGEYSTNDEGKLEAKNLNTGKYILKQTKVTEGYEKIEDTNFEIEENKTLQIVIMNKEKLEEQKPSDKTEENKDSENNKPSDKIEDNKENEIEKPKEDVKNEEIKDSASDINKEKNNTEIKDDKTNEKPKEDSNQNEEKKDENIEKGELAGEEKLKNDNKEEVIEKTEIPENTKNINLLKQKQSNIKSNKLPRTGDDYFTIKLMTFDLIIFIIFTIAMCLKTKRQTAYTVCQTDKIIK